MDETEKADVRWGEMFAAILDPCHVDHALNAVRLLAQESADCCAARKRINRLRKEFELFTKDEDALDDGLPRLIRMAREAEKLAHGMAAMLNEQVVNRVG